MFWVGSVPLGFSSGVSLRVALCGQDCPRFGEGGAERSRPVEAAGRAVGKVGVELQDLWCLTGVKLGP